MSALPKQTAYFTTGQPNIDRLAVNQNLEPLFNDFITFISTSLKTFPQDDS